MNRYYKFCLLIIVFLVSHDLMGQKTHNTKSVLCHDTIPFSNYDIDVVEIIEIYCDYCPSEKLSELKIFVNTKEVVINSFTGKVLPINLRDFPNLEIIRLINCKNIIVNKELGKIQYSNKVKEIELLYDNLVMIPPIIFNGFDSLEKLILYDNKITSIDPRLADLQMLKVIDLSSNNIKKQSVVWSKLTNLHELNLSENTSILNNEKKLVEFEESIVNLNVGVLWLSNCGIKRFPDKFNNLPLVNLDLSFNKIIKLPQFNEFRYLENLNLIGNKNLDIIPSEFKKITISGSQMPRE